MYDGISDAQGLTTIGLLNLDYEDDDELAAPSNAGRSCPPFCVEAENRHAKVQKDAPPWMRKEKEEGEVGRPDEVGRPVSYQDDEPERPLLEGREEDEQVVRRDEDGTGSQRRGSETERGGDRIGRVE